MRSLLISLFLTGLSLSNINARKISEEDKLAMKVRKALFNLILLLTMPEKNFLFLIFSYIKKWSPNVLALK